MVNVHGWHWPKRLVLVRSVRDSWKHSERFPFCSGMSGINYDLLLASTEMFKGGRKNEFGISQKTFQMGVAEFVNWSCAK